MTVKKHKKLKALHAEKLRAGEELVEIVKFCSTRDNLLAFSNALNGAVIQHTQAHEEYEYLIKIVNSGLLVKLSAFCSLLQLDQSEIVEKNVELMITDIVKEADEEYEKADTSFIRTVINTLFKYVSGDDMRLTHDGIRNDLVKLDQLRYDFINSGKLKSREKVYNMTSNKIKGNIGRFLAQTLDAVKCNLKTTQKVRLLDTLTTDVIIKNDKVLDGAIPLPFIFVNHDGSTSTMTGSCLTETKGKLFNESTEVLSKLRTVEAKYTDLVNKAKVGYQPIDYTYARVSKGLMYNMNTAISEIVDVMTEYSTIKKAYDS